MVATSHLPARYKGSGCLSLLGMGRKPGWFCENSNVCGHNGLVNERWFCDPCTCDICFTCRPITFPTTKTSSSLASNLKFEVNRAGVPVRLGTGMGVNNYYCGRVLGVKLIPFSDGRCGVNNGPQCMDCRGLTRASPPNAETVGLLSAVTVPVVVLYGSPLSVKITS